MNRRTLVFALAFGALAGPFVTSEALQARKAWRVATLVPGPPDCRITPVGQAFQAALQSLGYTNGQNLTIERRCYDEKGQPPLPDAAAATLSAGADVIVVWGSPRAVHAVKAQTITIPIVFVNVPDPVGAGLVSSLGHPGGNVTGITSLGAELETKRVELLKEALPHLTQLGVLVNIGSATYPEYHRAATDAAQKLRVKLHAFEVQSADQLESVFSAMTGQRIEAVLVPFDVFFWTHRNRIVALAGQKRLPAMFYLRAFVELGGLLSYSPSLIDVSRRAAVYVQKILHGARPADLPVEEPTAFELVINLKTAKALGLTIPQLLLLRADQLIQ